MSSTQVSTVDFNFNTLGRKIKKQKREIKQMKNHIDSLQSTVYQILGGLFNHTTQTEILEMDINTLFGENQDNEDVDLSRVESKWGQYPTTRQGDENERQIEILKECIGILMADLSKRNNYDSDSSSSITENEIAECETYDISYFDFVDFRPNIINAIGLIIIVISVFTIYLMM
jgi:chromosome segregation ATPase